MRRRLALLAVLIAALGASVALLGYRAAHKPDGQESGFLGLEFAPLTRAAQARAPFLAGGGAFIAKVVPESPAANAHFMAGEIVTAIDSDPVSSAIDADELLKTRRAGARVTLTYYDLKRGDGRPRSKTVELAAAPPKSLMVFSVLPPRTLAREWDFEPSMAARASWSTAIARGAVNPLPLKLFSRGRCSALAPEDWSISESSPNGEMFELVSSSERTRAVFGVMSVAARARVDAAVEAAIARYARITPEAGPALMAEGGYRIVDFGSSSGYAGFALYHVRPHGLRGVVLSLWIVAVPASNVAALGPLVGAVALSIRCDAPLSAPHRPYDKVLAPTSVSERCLQNDCDETDFAGAYNREMHTGYVHAANADNFLIDPRKDIWAMGPNGSGTYRQVGGVLEKLEPGRTN